MPSLKALHSHRASSPSQLFVADGRSAVWARSTTDDVSLSQLHKFWSGLSSAARRELLRIDKQALFEQVRKNLYCSRCHGLLVEGYAQIVSYGKNLQAGRLGYGNGSGACNKHLSEVGTNGEKSSLQDETRDPSVHPWGGLAATRDSMLTVLDCFLDGTPLEVFESARARERERELLYPDACGGGGRGWISQSSGSFGGSGRGHGMKETCALHTARLSCEALVDFWSALGEETRRSLLRMKEEDFIERLMFSACVRYRFDSKRFCRDCRRNVLREFKEMKELKRTRKEPRCTRWFCSADTAFRYEVSDSVVQVDWRDCFVGDGGSVYQHFEWALGTAEGKADILGFENVGLTESIYVEGLDLGNTAACYITVRGCKRDGRYTELLAKAHALKGQLCVHRRLIVGDGYVSITKGESIQRFFERAEETEEEEDDDSMDKDGNEVDGEGTRPQKHAKSPELARDFLLDAATVIFKEQVEKAFREGTARQNAHSIFVCLALSLLEERVRVACKEITTLEKQNKLLEEEEDEKREEEERRERRKLKEKEKKLRRKEKLKGKDREKDKCKSVANSSKTTPNGSVSGVSADIEDPEQNSADQDEESSLCDIDIISARPPSPDMAEARPSADGIKSESPPRDSLDLSSAALDIEDTLSMRDGNGAFIVERTKSSKIRSQGRQGQTSEGNRSGPSKREILDSGGVSRNPRRVAPTTTVENSTFQHKGTSRLGQAKNNGHRYEADGSKSLDSWHRRNGDAQLSLDDFLQCGCGGSQTNLRAKGNYRGAAKVCGKELPSKIGERVDSGGRGLSINVNYDMVYPQDKLDGSKGKVFTVLSAERNGEREQEKIDSDILEVARPGHSNSASAGELPGSHQNGRHQLPNRAFVHPANENGESSKSPWILLNSNTPVGPISRSTSFADRTVSHGNSKGISIRPTGRARPAGIVYQGKPGVATASTENTVGDLRPVGQALEQGQGPQISSNPVESNSSINVAKTQTTTGGDPPGQGGPASALDLPASDPGSDQSINVNEQAKLGVRGADSNCGTVAGNFVPPSEVEEISCNQPSDVALPPRPVTGSQFIAPEGKPGIGSKLVPRVFPSSDMSSQSAVRPLHMPTMIPAQIHVHPQSSFGYFQGHGSWGARNGVLPLPQPGGFLIPGSNGLTQSIGSLSPICLPPSVAQGTGVGHVSSLPNCLNTLQLRDSIFLSRFGSGPAPGGTDGRVPDPGESKGTSFVSVPETTTVIPTTDNVAPAETATSTSPYVAEGQKDDLNDSPVQVDTTGFSLFHFSGPVAVAQNEIEASALVPPSNESTSDKGLESLLDISKCGPSNDSSGGSADISTTAAEYSLFATAGKGLVFF
ncbi:unnamed protein product [Calypogeia fissa]